MQTLQPTRSPQAGRRKPDGFALVVTISLMILLTIIAVGLLTLSGITLRASSQGEAMQTARANARMALMIAIADLQKHTGPDQRVTMTADQRTKTTDGKESSAAIGNRHWTGVYRAWPATSRTRPAPEFLGWLTSGDPLKTDDEAEADTTLLANASIELLGRGTLGDNSPNSVVRVPSVKLLQKNGKSANLAWWVGDQGVKAAIATPPPRNEQTVTWARVNLQSAPRNAVQDVTAGQQKPFQSLKPDDARLSLVTSWQQTEFLADNVNSQQPLFHDLAPYSTGLLTNVTAGGFRKDLSMQLERPATSMPRTALYMVNNEPGINLSELWCYYNAHNEVRRSGSHRFTTSGTLASGTPHILVERDGAACNSDEEFHLKQPTIISYQMVLSLRNLTVTEGGVAKNRLHIVSDPIITMWNPLDIPVVIPTSSYVTVKYWQIPYDLLIRINGAAPIRAPLAASLSGATSTANRDYNYMSIEIGKNEPIVMKPGEVVKFSQSGAMVTTTGGAGNKNSLQAKKGFNFGGGFAMPARTLTGAPIDLPAGCTVTYEAFANQYTAGNNPGVSGNVIASGKPHSRHFSLTHHEVYVGPDRGELGASPPSLGYGGMYIDWDFGNRRLRYGEKRLINTPGTKSAGERLYANRFPDIFRAVSGSETRPLTLGALSANKSPFMLVSYNAKTEAGSETLTRSLARLNPKAHHIDFYDLSQREIDMLPYEFRAEPLLGWTSRKLDAGNAEGNGFFGGGMRAEEGTRFVVTHSFPREPLHSLAAFQHSFANGFEITNPVDGYATLNGREPMLPHISHAIGNSMAPSVLPPDRTDGSLSGGRPIADHSYLANLALWDDWFLSGIATRSAAAFGTDLPQKTVAIEFFSEPQNPAKKLPVVRYLPDIGDKNPNTLVNSWFSGNVSNNNAITNLASHLRVDGLFNVNSTSIEAWKALLGTLKGREIVVRDANGRETIGPAGEGSPVAGLLNPEDLVAKGSENVDILDPSQWVGRRELSDDEITELATAIVAEVRKRGPFLSLADFVNRRVGNNKELARAGTIQSALDSKDVRINRAFASGGREVDAAAARFDFPDAEKGPISYGIPGIVKQADILTPIAPVLSARSDSFIIRAYGEAVDGNGKISARAWCEAVVERDREFVDPADRAEAAPASLKKLNQDFGRRYELASFRWLAADEI